MGLSYREVATLGLLSDSDAISRHYNYPLRGNAASSLSAFADCAQPQHSLEVVPPTYSTTSIMPCNEILPPCCLQSQLLYSTSPDTHVGIWLVSFKKADTVTISYCYLKLHFLPAACLCGYNESRGGTPYLQAGRVGGCELPLRMR